MTPLRDDAIARLRAVAEQPDLSATRYELRELLGRGGMGAVFAAFDRELGRTVALKVISTAAETPANAARLRREAQILGHLEHPNIIPVHDVGILSDGRSFYTMKLVQGRRLDEHLQEGLVIAGRLQIFERICDALAFAHARGVVHRDLKPANIMVGPFGEVLVLDWGVAKTGIEPTHQTEKRFGPVPPSGLSGAGSIVGTVGFMSPEQAVGDPDVDARSDIHALGAMLRLMLESPGHGDERGQVPRRQRPLAAIADRALSTLPEARYQTVLELAEDLVRFRDGLPVQAYRENLLERFMRISARYKLPLALIVGYMLMRLLLLLMAPG